MTLPTLDELLEAGRRARFARFLEGRPRPGKRRRRPRTPGEQALLRQAALERLRRVRPYLRTEPDGQEVLALPYFSVQGQEPDS